MGIKNYFDLTNNNETEEKVTDRLESESKEAVLLQWLRQRCKIWQENTKKELLLWESKKNPEAIKEENQKVSN